MPKLSTTTQGKSSSKQKPTMPDPDISSAKNKDATTKEMHASKRLRMDGSPQYETEVDTTLTTDTFFASQQELTQMLSSWKTEQDKILSKIMADMRDLKEKCNEIKQSNIEIEKSMDFIHKENEILKNKIENLETEKKEDRERIQTLEKQLEETQLGRRSSSIEIKNVPMKQQETTEDLFSTVNKIANTIGMKIMPADVRDMYRLPAKPENIRSIVTEFNAVGMKHEFLSLTRSFNKKRNVADKLNTLNTGLTDENKPIYVDEHIPLSMKKLMYEVRQYAKTNNFEFCWYSNGKILLRKTKDSAKIITIKSEKCFKTFESQQ